jgi:hypothetical protein
MDYKEGPSSLYKIELRYNFPTTTGAGCHYCLQPTTSELREKLLVSLIKMLKLLETSKD